MKNKRMKPMSMRAAFRLFSLLALLSIAAMSALAQCAAIDQTVTVPENAGLVNTGVTINRGDTVVLTASGTIHAGVPLTGPNGPEGWADLRTAGANFPLPGARIYSLLGRIGGVSDLNLTLTTAASGGQAFVKGSVTLVGSGRFAGGFLDGSNATLVVTGNITPMP